MKISYLVDTDWIIDHFGRIQPVTRKMKELRPQGIALSIISVAELYEGVFGSKDPTGNHKALSAFLRKFPILAIRPEICRIFGEKRARLRKKGTLIGDFDLLIAATCLYHGLILLTNNRRHFELIEGIEILSISG